jgi:hypothetical protein
MYVILSLSAHISELLAGPAAFAESPASITLCSGV